MSVAAGGGPRGDDVTVAIQRIVIWSVDPRVPTAYGAQCGLLALELRRLGYDVTIAAIAARPKDTGRPWKSIPVTSVSDGRHGATRLAHVTERARADLVLMLFDSFMIDARAVDALPESVKVAYWCPVDASHVHSGGLPVLYRGMLQLAPRAVPVAMSRFGEAMFRHDGFGQVLYVPHMIDTGVFAPAADRAALREQHGIDPDAFVITICAANSELVRKNFPGQFDAFRRAMRDDWLLLVHSQARPDGGGWDLEWLAGYYGIADKVRFADPDRYRKGGYTPSDLAAWYGLADLHSQCTLAEGFGIPLIEAQACGVPAVATDGSATAELAGPGWTVRGEPFMSPLIRAEWTVPIRELIADAYRGAEGTSTPYLHRKAREFALDYSIPVVMENWWKPALAALEG